MDAPTARSKMPSSLLHVRVLILHIRLLVILILLLGLERRLGDTVQITLASLCDAAATLVLVNLYDTDLLESLKSLAVDRAGGVSVVGGARAAVLGGTIIHQYMIVVVVAQAPEVMAYPWTFLRRPTPTVLRMYTWRAMEAERT
jgi:hypothetical protein